MTDITFETIPAYFADTIAKENNTLIELMNKVKAGSTAYDMARLQTTSGALSMKLSALSSIVRQHKENLSTPIGNMR